MASLLIMTDMHTENRSRFSLRELQKNIRIRIDFEGELKLSLY
uniref:Uncharacterized protein n=1 Tax=Anguilla anguilla TaxID=7936 RepID=A0A0E9WFW6_ANGAN